MTLFECCVLEGITCILGCIVLVKYYENEMKVYEKINKTHTKTYTNTYNNTNRSNIKDSNNDSSNNEKIHLLYIQEQPMITIKHNH